MTVKNYENVINKSVIEYNTVTLSMYLTVRVSLNCNLKGCCNGLSYFTAGFGKVSTILYTETCLYAYSIQTVRSCDLVLEAVHSRIDLISEHCNFLLVDFRYSRILIF